MAVKTGISGLRGTVAPDETSLTPTLIVQWVQAFVSQLQKEGAARPFVALGHDARRSSPALAALAKGALLAAGADVLDLALTLTPTVQLTVRTDARLSGGLMITASHNPIIWNGLKFLDSQGLFIPPSWWEAMHAALEASRLPTVGLEAVGSVYEGGEVAWQRHLRAALDALPIETIRQRRYRVALDACNGGAARWADLLRALGCEPILLHSEPHGFFAREAEPLPAHLTALRELVRSARCDLGLAADPDGDRLVLVDARGEAVSEEHTVVLAAMALVREPGSTVVVNVVTTHALEAALPGTAVVRTAVGEMNVVQGTVAHRALLGGEGSGGIIVPRINLARDGLAAAGLILTLMAERDMPLHELVATIPIWNSVKGKLVATEGSPESLRALFAQWSQSTPEARLVGPMLRMGSAHGTLALSLEENRLIRLMGELPGGETFVAEGSGEGIDALFKGLAARSFSVVLTDGVKLQSEEAWLSLRPSNTEPIVRVMGEIRQ